MDRTQKLLRELIALPSVNPAFLHGQEAYTGERRVAELLAATGAGMGLDVELREVLPGRPNVLIRLAPTAKPSNRILLAPHMDTVGSEEVTDALFDPHQKNGRIYGRGACDTKGCIAVMLAALGELAQSPCRPAKTEIVFAGLIDEEHGQCGSRALVSDGFKADLAVVGEPTRLKVVTAHKGTVWLRIETSGEPAHGARPELGQNAIHTMARVVELLHSRYTRRLRSRSHPLLRPPTISVGVIAGGTQANVVPARCTITADRRTLPGETAAGVRSEITGLLRQNGLKARVALEKKAPCEPFEIDSNLPLVRRFMNITGQRRSFGVDYFCDASVLARGGIASVVFGPGDIAQAHTANEWISFEQLEHGRTLLRRFLETLP